MLWFTMRWGRLATDGVLAGLLQHSARRGFRSRYSGWVRFSIVRRDLAAVEIGGVAASHSGSIHRTGRFPWVQARFFPAFEGYRHTGQDFPDFGFFMENSFPIGLAAGLSSVVISGGDLLKRRHEPNNVQQRSLNRVAEKDARSI
ncbi:hypothetical protein [Mesorhizobium neociceri]|uniref:Uncharacterized protein n=1 Tax=Mesorhizobium neociceri TaxID=1307853 RepID=A0A838B5K2_9HYPH|nr:hypothetical protein [Mesorhizobium neociceri]MBA1141367.1 hypothetical protein [Mesorhizobium neociceri]